MKRLELNTDSLVSYGISSDLAEKAAKGDLTVTKVRTLSQKDLTTKFPLTPDEAKVVKDAVQRKEIDPETMTSLLERSNYVCNICHGMKSFAFIVHHIEPYAESQDNSYGNLIVLCPNDHDLAHGSGLTMGLSKPRLRSAKVKWERQVEQATAAKAARSVDVDESAIDYINIRRIEELCNQLFGMIPLTRATDNLTSQGIINEYGTFQQEYVRKNLSGGRYLFDYINSGEALHYRDLMAEIAKKVTFDDLNAAIDSGKRQVTGLEGHYAFFIGGVFSKRPDLPIDVDSPEVVMHYTKKKIRIEWILDPNFFFAMSAICRQGKKNRYIIYCQVRTVDVDSRPGHVLVKASPFLVAQPSVYANRIPPIGWQYRCASCLDESPL